MSYYRSRGPLSRLAKEYDDIEIIPIQSNGMFDIDVRWSEIALGDILFMQRPATAGAAEIIKLANKMGIPVWVDYDDLLTSIPKFNRSYGFYNSPGVLNAIEQVLMMAQVVTVTTPFLQREFSRLSDNVVLIPNAIDDYMYPEPIPFSDNNSVVWRGGDTHMSDLHYFKDDINEMINMYPSKNFEFIGYDVPFIDQKPNKIFTPPLSLFSYFDYLRSLNPSYNMVVLEPHEFNYAKSNISWLESHWAGAISVAPYFNITEDNKYEVYDGDGYHIYGCKKGDLMTEFSDLVGRSNQEKNDIWDAGVEEIREKYVLSATNKLRMELIRDLKIQFS